MRLRTLILLATIIQQPVIWAQPVADVLFDDKGTEHVRQIISKSGSYRFTRPDSSLLLAEQALELARQINYREGECEALITIGEDLRLLGDIPEGLEAHFEALEISRDIGDRALEAQCYIFIGVAYAELDDSRQALHYLFKANDFVGMNDTQKVLYSFNLTNIGLAYERLNMLDSALHFQQQAWDVQVKLHSDERLRPLRSLILRHFGDVYRKKNDYDTAVLFYRRVIKNGDLLNTPNAQCWLANYYLTRHVNLDSSLYYGRQALVNGRRSIQEERIQEASEILSKTFDAMKVMDSSYYYFRASTEIRESIFSIDRFRKLQLLAIREQRRQHELAQEQTRYVNNVKLSILFGTMAVLFIAAAVFYRNYQQKQKANRRLEETLDDLKSTQAQLIHAEKMASLGELTAGIAHEIQNPLNFVNNFADLNSELVGELEQEVGEGHVEEARRIIAAIRENEEKIVQHGKRADAIVKGMLQHSRSSAGTRESVDLNRLVDEYARLAYHGARAKDRDFNVKLETALDKAVGQVMVVPQEIGRVVLNLIANAFQATEENGRQQIDFQPLVRVSTKRIGDFVEVQVADNGPGIPEKIMGKIFQPFFTTKPAGQGTGLGLSLSYDIVKSHGGVLSVNSTKASGTIFTVRLPLKTE